MPDNGSVKTVTFWTVDGEGHPAGTAQRWIDDGSTVIWTTNRLDDTFRSTAWATASEVVMNISY